MLWVNISATESQRLPFVDVKHLTVREQVPKHPRYIGNNPNKAERKYSQPPTVEFILELQTCDMALTVTLRWPHCS